MDTELTREVLRQCEARRRLHLIPEDATSTAWTAEAHVEAVVDAVLNVSFDGDVCALARARHVGEWSARIAAELDEAVDPKSARRIGVLSDVNPNVLMRIEELKPYASAVADYQKSHIAPGGGAHVFTLIVNVAREFEDRIESALFRGRPPARAILNSLIDESCDEMKRFALALSRSLIRRAYQMAPRTKKAIEM